MTTTSTPPVIPSADSEIWYTRCPVPTGFGLALARGDFDREFGGGAISWLQLQSSPDVETHRSHFTHTKENSFRHGGNIPAIWARSRGADTKLVGLSWVKTGYPILALPESGITTVADLKGKRLLVPRHGSPELPFWKAVVLNVYEKALATVGLTLDDVELVEVAGNTNGFAERAAVASGAATADLPWTLKGNYRLQRNQLLPLVRGEADAVATQSQLGIELAELTGAQPIIDLLDSPHPLDRVNNDAPDTLTVSGRFAQEHPDRVARVIARIIAAADWGRTHQREALEQLSHELQMPVGLVEASFGADVSEDLDLKLDPLGLDAIRSQQNFLLRHGFIDEGFDVDDWVDPRPLELARELLASGVAYGQTAT
jgi:ABC-type nitrate/sulfonate/bicarbonate transport system substrate-binding protein